MMKPSIVLIVLTATLCSCAGGGILGTAQTELEGVWEASDRGCSQVYTPEEVSKGVGTLNRKVARKLQLAFSGNNFRENWVDCSDGSINNRFTGTFIIGSKVTNKQGIEITEMDTTGKQDGREVTYYFSYYLKDNVFILATFAPNSSNDGTSPEKRTSRINRKTVALKLYRK